MFKELFGEKNQKRRIASMLEKNFSRIKYLLLLALLLMVPAKSWAGAPGLFDTDGLNAQMVGFWDLRNRNSFAQVTNTSALPITVHVQIFNAASGCLEVDFYDTYTGNDTHVYDLRGIVRNDGGPLSIVLPDGGFGIIVVTNVAGVFGPALGNFIEDYVLTGNFRVVDFAGYEYRSNFDGVPNILTGLADDLTFNFNNVNGNSLSDVVGIVLDDTGPGFFEVIAAGTFITFDVFLFDQFENPISCDLFTFACTASSLDVGINGALPNSRGAGSLCPANVDTVGHVRLFGVAAAGDYFTGFVGLNNGDGTGSMDTWWGPLPSNGVAALDSLGQGGLNLGN
ncbi:MAG TPA: hypothetical protein VNN20_08560 [Thermodesulfobacteriota bacterium]|nr:hypothetical protein [Thermodesulfobacteriota bacterium]